MDHCPKCQSEINDGICPNCGHDVSSTETAPEEKAKFQFGLRFLFFLITMTAVVCGISKALDNWFAAPLIVVNGLLFWRTRRSKYACLPGFALGLAFGWLITLYGMPGYENAVRLGFATIGAGTNAQLKGYRKSGYVALVAAYLYMVIMHRLLR